MKIVQLIAENVKKLAAVEIKPDGNLVQITGKNGSGKTSVLDSILWALTGTREMQKQPIRRGETTARIRLDLGELIVTRKITEAGSTLTVESAEGARYPSPQAMIDKLLGSISFDPLGFARQKPREQFDTLRTLVQVDVDFEKIDGMNRADFAKRTELNKEAKSLRAQAEAARGFPETLPAAPIDTSALVDEIGAAGQHNANIEIKREARKAMAEKATKEHGLAKEHSDRARRLREEADEHDRAAQRHTDEAVKLTEQLAGYDPLPEPIDPAALKTKLAEAEATNREIERKARRDDVLTKADAIEAEARKHTERIEAREQVKQTAIAAAKMPVEGISFGDGAVLLNGLPFEQASDAEQLRASCAIAMAMNPKLRVLRIRDGSLLDEEGLRLLSEMADANDYQVWVERVDSSGAVGVVMEEGRVKAMYAAEKIAEPELAGVSA